MASPVLVQTNEDEDDGDDDDVLSKQHKRKSSGSTCRDLIRVKDDEQLESSEETFTLLK